MLTVIHTFNGSNAEEILGNVRAGIQTVEDINGFKFVSINKRESTKDIMLFSKWENRTAYDNWANTIEENKAFKSSTPQMFEVLEEKY